MLTVKFRKNIGGVTPVGLKKKLRPMTSVKNYNKSFRETKTDSIYGCRLSNTMCSTFAKYKGNHSKKMILDPIEKDAMSTTEAGRLLFAKIDNYIATVNKHN